LEAAVTELLRDRVASALAADATPDHIRDVLADVEVARRAAEATAESARSRALDPLTADVPAARKTADDAIFERDRLAEVARRLAPRVAEAAAREATMKRRAELERVLARNRLAEEMARMVEPIMQIAHLVSRIDASDCEIRGLGFTQVRHFLADAPEIATLFGEVFVWDAFLALARRS
jgi:hypothetical protein